MKDRKEWDWCLGDYAEMADEDLIFQTESFVGPTWLLRADDTSDLEWP